MKVDVMLSKIKSGIYTIDSHYAREQLAAVFMIIEGNQVALVETANAKSLSYVQAELLKHGLTTHDVKYIFLTHIHLDHAGGAGGYMAEFPLAKLVVHPKGARHMINPAKLEAGVTEVYGEKFVTEMYGKLSAIDVERIIVAEDGLEINLNGRSLVCRDTPGHANHHNVIFDRKANVVFTGDIFGVAYPEFEVEGKTFTFPATTPVNFDPHKMERSIDLIVGLQPEAVYLTHFGRQEDVERIAIELKRMVKDYVQITLECANENDIVAVIKSKLQEYMLNEIAKFGIVDLSNEMILQLLDMDLQINAQGLAVWLKSFAKIN